MITKYATLSIIILLDNICIWTMEMLEVQIGQQKTMVESCLQVLISTELTY